MKNKMISFAIMLVLLVATGCTTTRERYNTQRGAAIGAGLGAIAGQAIGRNTEGTLLGAGIGTLLGSIVGNAVDQNHAVAQEAVMTNKRVVYYDDRGGAVEAIPGPVNQSTKCQKITKRVWDKGNLVSESTEEICEGERLTRTY